MLSSVLLVNVVYGCIELFLKVCLKLFEAIEYIAIVFHKKKLVCLVHYSINLTIYLNNSKDWGKGLRTSEWITSPVFWPLSRCPLNWPLIWFPELQYMHGHFLTLFVGLWPMFPYLARYFVFIDMSQTIISHIKLCFMLWRNLQCFLRSNGFRSMDLIEIIEKIWLNYSITAIIFINEITPVVVKYRL